MTTPTAYPPGSEITGADIPGLTSRDRVFVEESRHWFLVIERRSRIIMADGKRLLDKIRAVQEVFPDIHVDIRSGAPVCGKTRAFLAEHDIAIVPL
ncbi:hypothetical protein JXO52_07280 [bacterium]|nr:hypothetical protein [bacterium]